MLQFNDDAISRECKIATPQWAHRRGARSTHTLGLARVGAKSGSVCETVRVLSAEGLPRQVNGRYLRNRGLCEGLQVLPERALARPDARNVCQDFDALPRCTLRP